MQTILTQAVMVPTFGNLTWLVPIGVAVYLAYKALYKKEEMFQKLVTGIPALVILFMLVGLNQIPATIVTAAFGPVGFVATIFFQLTTYALLGAFLAVAAAFVMGLWDAEIAIPGFS